MFRTNGRDSGRRRIRSATRTTSALSAFAMCAGALVATTAVTSMPTGIAAATDGCEGNLITNGDFETTSVGPDVNDDEDIQVATGWGPIWENPSGVSTGDVFGPGAWGGAQEPTPASGNYGGFWVDSGPTQLIYREGIMNTLSTELEPDTGLTSLSFETSQVFIDNATLGVYGVKVGADLLGLPPTTPSAPTNDGLFPGKVMKLGEVSLLDTETNARESQTISIDTTGWDSAIDRVFVTRAETTGSGKAYITVDDFCLPVPVLPPSTGCEGNLVANGDFEDVISPPNDTGDEDIHIATNWGPIWDKPSGGSTGDMYAPGFLIPSAEPTPASGNFAVFWVDNSASPSLLFREGIMNQLSAPLEKDAGLTKLTFTTSQIFVENSTIAVYGVHTGAPALGVAPTSGTTPTNDALFGTGGVEKLGVVNVYDTENNVRLNQSIDIDTSDFDGDIDRIFLTREDATDKAEAFVTFDDFCLPVPTPVRPVEVCEGNLITNGDFETTSADPDLKWDEDITVATGWSPIWAKPFFGSTGDVHGASQWSWLSPAPASGNFGAFWVDSSPTTLKYREGIMNTLQNELTPGTGKYALSFTTAQIYSANATMEIFGVRTGATGTGGTPTADAPTGAVTPANTALFGSDSVEKLGEIALFDTGGSVRISQSIDIDRADLEEPMDRVFFTRSDTTGNGKTYVAIDDVCLTGAGSAVTMLETPGRLMDTRTNGDTPDDIAEKEGPLGSDENDPFGNGVYRLQVANRLGVEADASASVLNVTAINPAGAGYLTIFPCNGATPTPPLAASLNFGPDTRAVGNNVTVGLDDDGDVCIFSSVESDIAVDIAGFFPHDSAFETILPERFVDTRPSAQAAQVVTGGIVGGGNALALTKLEIDVAGVGSVPDDAIAVAMNVAAVNPAGQGFATLYPCDVSQPLTASLNFAAGVNVSNGVVIGVAQTSDVATDGKVCAYTSTATNLVIDVAGYYPAGGGFIPSSPVRYLDTRTVAGADTVDGINQGAGMVAGGDDFTVQITGRPGVPVGASAVAVNFASIRPSAEATTGFTSPGFITAYPGPCGTQPLASNLNVSIGDVVRANGAVIALPASGEICVYASRNMDLIMDVTGYFPA